MRSGCKSARKTHESLRTRLREEEAHHNYIRESGAEAIAELLFDKGLQDLKELHLSHNEITAAVAQCLVKASVARRYRRPPLPPL